MVISVAIIGSSSVFWEFLKYVLNLWHVKDVVIPAISDIPNIKPKVSFDIAFDGVKFSSSIVVFWLDVGLFVMMLKITLVGGVEIIILGCIVGNMLVELSIIEEPP